MEGLSHTPFIAAAYIIFFVVLGALGVMTAARARAAKKQADTLEAAAPRRRRSPQQ